jgi:F-type H+-transporting ATPase subunit b
VIVAASSPLTKIIPGLMIWTIVFFGITFYILKRFAFGRIQAQIDARRVRILEAIKEADAARTEARELLGQAKSESADILAEARKVADAQMARVRDEAEADRQRRLEDTRKQIDAETSRAIDQIRSEVADLTVEATERVVGKVLDAEDQRRLIDEAIAELDFSALERGRN